MAENLAESLEPPVTPEEIAADTAAADKPEVEVKETKEVAPEEEKKQTLVPHGALHEERQKRKAIEATLRQEQEERRRNEAVLADRLQQLYQVSQPQQKAPQYRDPQQDPDPLAAMQHNQQLTAQQLYNMQVEQQEQMRRAAWQQQQEEAARNLTGWAKHQAQEYTKENPEFPDAYAHIRKVRAQELQLMGWQGEALVNQLHNEELNVFHLARSQGKNPAEVAFEMAKATGWQAKKKDGEQQIETLQKGTQAAKSLGQGQEPGRPTLEQLANMSEDEFAAEKAKLSKSGKRMSDIL